MSEKWPRLDKEAASTDPWCPARFVKSHKFIGDDRKCVRLSLEAVSTDPWVPPKVREPHKYYACFQGDDRKCVFMNVGPSS